MQVKSAERTLRRKIEEMNKRFAPYRMKLEHVVEHQTSYIKLYLPNHPMWIPLNTFSPRN